ncbi:Ger(x)C family spore germination protein [Paenibacillus ginsengarvi]|uniref:Ger(X)C family spore germination protein n=1 Tax=Paenibacillus ginsengarvi TaxID=400777 RepID=A0A3B0BZY7_9BACL|nr:Ger(x)C family spore germination protein [Paenibacillus ginsengarvi]RKN79103.1 Ger(x)C family spore germination protein [Paenibacillus ginsengarvi]
MKIRRAVALSLCLLLLTTGCWNSKDIQNMAYVTALGFDYEDGKIVTYVQVLNFMNIAKGEAMEIGRIVPNWIGKGEGRSVTESLNSIYTTSQLRIFWGHIKAIVMTEKYMQDDDRIKETYDFINRYREIRYNILLYGTKESVRDLFAMKSLLNMSPIESAMDTPSQMYSQRSFILPVYGFKILAQFNEPAEYAMLPSLSIDSKSWTEDKKNKPLFKIDGAYFFNDYKLAGWLTEDDLEGARWLQKKLERSAIHVPGKRNIDAALVLIKPKPSVHHIVQDGKARFRIKLTIQGYVDELVDNISKKEIEDHAAKVLQTEMRHTFQKGLDIKADVLQLGEVLYRENPKLWKSLSEGGQFILNEDSLDSVDVRVNLQHSGKYKLRVN